MVHVARREIMGFVSSTSVDAATTIVGSPSPRTWLVAGDHIYLGLGEGATQVGEEFTIYQDAVPVFDLNGYRLLGYHVEILGWAVVRELKGETSIAELRMVSSEIRRGYRALPRPPVILDIPVKISPDGIEGNIVFMPDFRTTGGDGDYLYLNRGSLHGFEVGSEVEVYEPGYLVKERVSGQRVMTPDRIVANMVLVEVRPDSSVAFVVNAHSELEIGAKVRATMRTLARK